MKTLLLVAHPGHELLLWKWLGEQKPHAAVLTDGSGTAGSARIQHTESVLREAGATWLSQIVAPVPDRTVYSALMTGTHGLFTQWRDQLVRHVVAHDIERIVADQSEGFNASHELCHLLASAVAEFASREGRRVDVYEFSTIGHPSPVSRLDDQTWITQLSDADLQTKVAALKDYAMRCGGPLVQEVDELFSTFGEQAYARECLFPARAPCHDVRSSAYVKPYFETRGEECVAQGLFKDALRSRHLQMAADALKAG